MSTLPPGAPGAPNPAGNEPGGASETPRWAAPAVPPPWVGAAQPASTSATEPAAAPAQAQPAPQAQPGWQQPGFAPAAASRPAFDRQKWLPTVAVAAVIAGVVLGGIGLDKAIAAPSVGTVQLGSNARMTAAPGWALVETSDTGGVTLQKGNVRIFAIAESYSGTAHAMLLEVEKGLRNEVDQINFGSEQSGKLGGHDAAMVGFEAIVSGSSGSGTVDGEAICMIVGPDGVLVEAVAPLGMLDSAASDIKAMALSVEVGQ